MFFFVPDVSTSFVSLQFPSFQNAILSLTLISFIWKSFSIKFALIWVMLISSTLIS